MLILTKEYEAPLTALTARTTPSVTPKRIVWYAVLDAIGQNPTTSPMRNGDKLENSSGPGRKPYGTRLYQISKCMDNLEEIRRWAAVPGADHMLNLLGQMDQWEELHRLLYEMETSYMDAVYVAETLNDLSKDIRRLNDKWWHDPTTSELIQRNSGEQFMLMVSEIAEAMEGHRKNLMDDKLPQRPMVEVELADAIIRIMDYAGNYNMDIGGALIEKLEYNATRKDHNNEARLGTNGKKY